MNEALSESKHKNETAYPTWVTYFTQGAGARSEVVLKAMLAYWLSWYVLPSGPKDGMNPYVFPLAVRLAKGEKLALAPVFLGSLFFNLDECGQNLVKSIGWYTVVSYANTSFL